MRMSRAVLRERLPGYVGQAVLLDHERAGALIDQALNRALAEVEALSVPERLDLRYEKFRRMGEEGTAFVDERRAER